VGQECLPIWKQTIFCKVKVPENPPVRVELNAMKHVRNQSKDFSDSYVEYPAQKTMKIGSRREKKPAANGN
jgi:hypothetical protein